MTEFDCLLERHILDVVLKPIAEAGGKTQYSGYIDGEKEYNSFIVDLKALGFLFSTENSNQNKSSRIVFSYEQKNADIRIPYFGSPFQVVKSTYMACCQGGSCEPKKTPKPLMSDHPLYKKPWTRNKRSKKTGCQAFMTVKCIRVFGDECYRGWTYKRGSTENAKIMEKLNKDLQTSSPPTGTLRYYILMSPAEDHNHTIMSMNLNHRLDPRLKEEIHSYTKQTLCSVDAMRERLHELVREMFENSDHPKPHIHNRCYYPIDKVIRFHMNQALSNVQNDYDQGVLEECIERWIREYPEDRFFYRPYKVPSGSDRKLNLDKEPAPSTLLFCHQTKWQRYLLSRYGNDISLLDSTYKTCKYSFPLFFIIVKTNCVDAIVGTFVVQRETSVLMEEALSYFKAWNPDWDPEYLMVDNSEANVTALEQTFPQAVIYVSPFHREQAWERFLYKKGNVKRKAVISLLTLWQTIAVSQDEEDYKQNLEAMYNSDVYQASRHAQGYFCSQWLPVHQMWVEAYHTELFVSRIATNNGAECLNNTLQHSFLTQRNDQTLSGVIRDVVENILPEVVQKYSFSNLPLDYREYNEAVPHFLKNRPVPFIESVMSRFEEAKEYDASQITEMGDGLFIVRNEVNVDEWCSVNFQAVVCSCYDFGKWRVPCKHMCAVFLYTEWDFDTLPLSYRQHPYVVVDADFLEETGVSLDVATAAITSIAETDDQQQLVMEVEVNLGQEEDEITTEDHDMTSEVVNLQQLMEETRDKLKMILGYTYLQYEPVNALKFAHTVALLEAEMSDAAHQTVKGLSLGPTDFIVPVNSKKYLPLKTGDVKYFPFPPSGKSKLNLPVTSIF